jgi:hypothetical protein
MDTARNTRAAPLIPVSKFAPPPLPQLHSQMSQFPFTGRQCYETRFVSAWMLLVVSANLARPSPKTIRVEHAIIKFIGKPKSSMRKPFSHSSPLSVTDEGTRSLSGRRSIVYAQTGLPVATAKPISKAVRSRARPCRENR